MAQMCPSVLSSKCDNSADRAHFLSLYQQQKTTSFRIACATGLLALAAPLAALTKHPVFATACAISAVGLGAFWYLRPDDPKNLAHKVFRALGTKNESEECPCITEDPGYKIACPICPCVYEKNILSILKKGADLDYRYRFDWQSPPENLLEYASRQGYLEIVKYLVGLGFTLEKTRAVSSANFVSTVKFLAEKGASLDSALEDQFLRLVKTVKIHMETRPGRSVLINNVCKIMRFLRNQGVTREPKLAPHYIDLFKKWAEYDFTPDGRLGNFLKAYEDWSEKGIKSAPPVDPQPHR
jgi:hypothetical protein